MKTEINDAPPVTEWDAFRAFQACVHALDLIPLGETTTCVKPFDLKTLATK